jgi:hypothetical protein
VVGGGSVVLGVLGVLGVLVAVGGGGVVGGSDVGVGVVVAGGVASLLLDEQAARSVTASATTSVLPRRAIGEWYFVPTTPQWATSAPNGNPAVRARGVPLTG